MPPLKLRPILLLVAGIAVILVVNLFSLAAYPMPHCDEAGNASISWNAATRGIPAFDFLAQDNALRNESGGRYMMLLAGNVLRVFGSSHLVHRLTSTTGWILASILLYAVGRRLFSPMAGLIAAMAFTTSLNVFGASHIARQEIWVIAAALGLCLFYLHLREGHTPWKVALLGLLAAQLAVEIHLMAIFLIMPLLLWAGIEMLWRRRYSALTALIAGGVAGAALLLPLHDFSGLGSTLATTTTRHCDTPFCLPGTPAALWDYLRQNLASFAGFVSSAYLRRYSAGVLLFMLYALCAAVYSLFRGGGTSRLVLAYLALSLGAFMLLMPHRNPFYAPLWDAGFALLIAATAIPVGEGLTAYLSRRAGWPGGLRPYGGLLLVLPLLAGNLFVQAYLGLKFAPRDFDGYLDQIEARVPPGAHLMGDAVLWYRFHERNEFTADMYFADIFGQGRGPDSAEKLAEEMRQLAPDYVVDTGAIACSVDPTLQSQWYSAYLQVNCQPVARIDDPWFGAYGQIGQGGPTIIYACGP
ncbi:MAG: glycosyltransferase family 39 protein [Anaerolineae bacterium]|nr:glycosyltransferase family 39 protein [Anaerolineae bacterium]